MILTISSAVRTEFTIGYLLLNRNKVRYLYVRLYSENTFFPGFLPLCGLYLAAVALSFAYFFVILLKMQIERILEMFLSRTIHKKEGMDEGSVSLWGFFYSIYFVFFFG